MCNHGKKEFELEHINIAIDGTSGSGKSTAAKNVASSLGIEYIDTGAMYRAAALKAVNLGVDIADEKAVETMMRNTDIDFSDGCIYLDGENVNGKIRTLEISAAASEISKLAACRSILVDIQRRIAEKKSVVMDGRDIGTNVLPSASHKFYIYASLDVRAERRLLELKEKGEETDLESVKKDLAVRDENDMNRKINPLRKADGAIEICTDDLNIEEVRDFILSHVNS